MNWTLNRILRWMPVFMLGALLLGGSSGAFAQGSGEREDLVLTGDAACTRCHDDGDDFPVLAIGKTRHAVAADGRTPTCTSCHGDSDRHIRNLREADETSRPKPDRAFSGQLLTAPADDLVDRYFGRSGKGSTTPAVERNQVCLDCHRGGARIHWENGPHANRDVACTSCHVIHTQHDKVVRDKQAQSEVCFSCHTEQRAQVNRPSHHSIRDGKVACSDCHNPHGTAGEKQLVRDSVNATCYTCHMEKRGPFIHSHQPVTEDCTICHNPHGTVNDNLLKVRAPFLCQQCHEPSSHRGTIPEPTANPATYEGRVSFARGCLNCHTNIHGSNNPVDSSASRSLRQ